MNLSESRILIETLRLTREQRSIWAYELASTSRTSEHLVRQTLSRALERAVSTEVKLSQWERVQLAIALAKSYDLAQTARTLDWREFEGFAEECLRAAGYKTERNVRFSEGKRRWEIDIVAQKQPVMLSVDCKHWAHSSPQRLRDAMERQRNATISLTMLRRNNLDCAAECWTLPVVLTLFENELRSEMNSGVFVPVGRLQDFLGHLTHYDQNIPFLPPPERRLW